MTIIRVLAAATLFAGVALGVASPARADQVIQGVYTYAEEGKPPGEWTIYPICVPTVGDLRVPLELPVACTLHVSGAYTGDARLTGGLWAFSVSDREGMQCPDGSSAPTVDVFKFDDATLIGTHTLTYSAICGMAPAAISTPFTLSFKKELPIPVDRYPLDCEPGGLRICS